MLIQSTSRREREVPPGGEGFQRSDAQRNRERILDAARAGLARDPEAPLSVIAKNAGVGQGTFYRNFPDREALVWALYHREAQRLVENARELLESSPPDVALREWMTQLALFAKTKAGLATAMRRTILPTDEPARPGHALIVDTIGLLLAANRRAGTIRPDVTVEDFSYAIAGIFLITPDDNWQAQVDRLLDLVMAGLRAGLQAGVQAGLRADTAGHGRAKRPR